MYMYRLPEDLRLPIEDQDQLIKTLQSQVPTSRVEVCWLTYHQNTASALYRELLHKHPHFALCFHHCPKAFPEVCAVGTMVAAWWSLTTGQSPGFVKARSQCVSALYRAAPRYLSQCHCVSTHPEFLQNSAEGFAEGSTVSWIARLSRCQRFTPQLQAGSGAETRVCGVISAHCLRIGFRTTGMSKGSNTRMQPMNLTATQTHLLDPIRFHRRRWKHR